MSYKKQKKICILCGKEFMGSPTSKICFDKHTRKCEVCGKEFEVSRYYLKQKCCSRKCADILGKQNREKTNLERYGTVDPGNNLEIFTEKRKQTCQKKWGTDYSFQAEEVKAHIEQTNMERYGVPNANMNTTIKSKVLATKRARYGGVGWEKGCTIKSKIDATNLERYGTLDPGNRPEALEKRKQTNIEHYGAEWYTQTEEYKKRVNATSQEKYGTDWPMQSPQVKNKQRENSLKKYGVPYPVQSDIVKETMKRNIQSKYGVDWPRVLPQCVDDQGTRISTFNQQFSELLTLNDIEHSLEFPIGRYQYDIKVSNTLIEIDPTYSHSVQHTEKFGAIDEYYHMEKTALAEDRGYRCIHIFDWDDWNKIVQLLQHKQPLYARNLDIQKIDKSIVDEFLDSYHLQGTCRGQTYAYGLYDNQKLVQLMTFGKPRYSQKFEYELLRLCTHPEYVVTGGAHRLFSRFLKDLSPSSIVSYCDLSKFQGHVYSKLGFNYSNKTITPSKHWSYGKHHITDNLLRQRGFDQLFGTNYGKGTSNEQLMLDHDWLPICDCGQARYEWRRQ